MTEPGPLTVSELDAIDAWWRAANYLSVGQIYLLGNPLLAEPLRPEHVKPRLLGHWGTTPGLNLIYAHLNRVIRNQDLNAIYVCGPGHGGPGMVANTYLEGTYSELYPGVTQDTAGMARLFKQFSFPGGIPLARGPGDARLDPRGRRARLLADPRLRGGVRPSGPDRGLRHRRRRGRDRAAGRSWHSDKFLNPVNDGAVLPILHLNGYKIANPTVLARIPAEELESLLRGYGLHPVHRRGRRPQAGAPAARRDHGRGPRRDPRHPAPRPRRRRPEQARLAGDRAAHPQGLDRAQGGRRPAGGGHRRAHQVPLTAARQNPEHLARLEEWMRSYHAEELFDADGALIPELAALAPVGDRRMGANPHANGGLLLRDLRLPDFRDYAADVPAPGATASEATRVLGTWLQGGGHAPPRAVRHGHAERPGLLHLVMDVIDRVPDLSSSAGHVRQLMVDKRIEARAYTREQGEDAPEVANWTWPS